MADNSLPSSGAPPTPTNMGASVQPVYARRTMKVYAINESEVSTISNLNSQSTLALTLATFFLGLALSIYTNGVFYTTVTPAGELAEKFVGPVLFFIAIICAGWAGYVAYQRKGLWEEIKRESGG